jgi:hypothetical protein
MALRFSATRRPMAARSAALGKDVEARGEATVVSPKTPRAPLAARFAEAVKISRGWAR